MKKDVLTATSENHHLHDLAQVLEREARLLVVTEAAPGATAVEALRSVVADRLFEHYSGGRTGVT